jgi:hypothetical protein
VTGTIAADATVITGFGADDVLDVDAATGALTKTYEEIATAAADIATDATVIVIGGTTTIADAATAIAADVTVTGTTGIIVISDGTDTFVYSTTNLGANGTEVLLATFVGIANPLSLVTANFSV